MPSFMFVSVKFPSWITRSRRGEAAGATQRSPRRPESWTNSRLASTSTCSPTRSKSVHQPSAAGDSNPRSFASSRASRSRRRACVRGVRPCSTTSTRWSTRGWCRSASAGSRSTAPRSCRQGAAGGPREARGRHNVPSYDGLAAEVPEATRHPLTASRRGAAAQQTRTGLPTSSTSCKSSSTTPTSS